MVMQTPLSLYRFFLPIISVVICLGFGSTEVIFPGHHVQSRNLQGASSTSTSSSYSSSSSSATTEEEDWSDSKMSAVITYVDRQRMYCQKMTKEVLLIFLEHEIEDNLWLMLDTATKFEYIQRALRYGDHQLYIPPTTDPEILLHLDLVDQLWAPLEEELHEVERKGHANVTDIDKISLYEPPLEHELEILLHLYEAYGEADHEELDEDPLPHETVVAIELAGGQRLLSQKMVSDYLFVVAGYHVDEHLAGLAQDVYEFDHILQGLYHGNDELELHAATSPVLIDWLDRVSAIWEGEDGFKATMTAEPSFFMLDYVASQNIPLLGRMNVVVGLYKKLATTPPPPPSQPSPPAPPPGSGTTATKARTYTFAATVLAMVSFVVFG